MRKQNTMDAGDGIEEIAGGVDSEHGSTHHYTRSFSPSNLQLPVDFISAQRLDRESSLEAIQQPESVVILEHMLTSEYVCINLIILYTYNIMRTSSCYLLSHDIIVFFLVLQSCRTERRASQVS